MITSKNYRQLIQVPGRYRDVAGEIRGLMLVVKNERSASWQLRFERAGKETWMGLGSARLLSLTEARTRARAVRHGGVTGSCWTSYPVGMFASVQFWTSRSIRRAMT